MRRKRRKRAGERFVDLAEYEAEYGRSAHDVVTLLIWSEPFPWQPDDGSVRVQIYQYADPDGRRWDGSQHRWVWKEGASPRPAAHAAGFVECDSLSAAVAEVPLLLFEKSLTPRWSVFSNHWIGDEYPRAWHRLPDAYTSSSTGIRQEWPAIIALGTCLHCRASGVCPDCTGGRTVRTHNGRVPCVCAGSLVPGQCPICENTGRQPIVDKQYDREFTTERMRGFIRESQKTRWR